ncbi:MAG: ATP-binding protein [Caulobacteraceae bacterium]
MPKAANDTQSLMRQQQVLAAFGELALRCDDLDEILTEACRLVGDALGTDLAKVMELQDDTEALLVRAGVGWKPGVVGRVIVTAEDGSSEGYALKTGEPVVSDDIATETRFTYADFLTDNGVRALVNVIILGGEGKRPYGLLQVDSRAPRAFGEGDTTFLRTYANLLAAAVDRIHSDLEKSRTLDRQREAEEAHQAELRAINETLEARVAQRTADLHEAQEQRRVAEERMRQSQKMEAVGQLTGGVAHDFNNLLTIIRSSVDFLKRPDLPEPRRTRYVEAISETVERAARLTRQLLAFARRQPLKPEVFDVSRQVAIVADLVRPIVGSRVIIEVSQCDKPCFAEADVSQFETALVNLSVNARDAMNGEGRLIFEIKRVSEIPPTRGHVEATGEFIAIHVRDTGSGIPPDQLDAIFEPFFTTKEVGQGTGLGLSQVFGFVKQSGGEVDVESRPGEGSTFTIYIPHSSAETAKAISHTPDHPADSSFSACVLVVEDNDRVGQFATEMLQDLGYKTIWAGGAEKALTVLAEDAHEIGAVFSDVVMPGMSGVELAKVVRSRYPEIPVILTTGYSDVLAKEGRSGFELLRKPYSADELNLLLGKVLTVEHSR